MVHGIVAFLYLRLDVIFLCPDLTWFVNHWNYTVSVQSQLHLWGPSPLYNWVSLSMPSHWKWCLAGNDRWQQVVMWMQLQYINIRQKINDINTCKDAFLYSNNYSIFLDWGTGDWHLRKVRIFGLAILVDKLAKVLRLTIYNAVYTATDVIRW